MPDIAASTKTKAMFDADSFSGTIEKPGDRDWIKVELQPGINYRFYASFSAGGSPTVGDVQIVLRDKNGNPVADADQGGVDDNAILEYKVPIITGGGTYFLDIGEAIPTHAGEYSVYATWPFGIVDKLLTIGNDSYSGAANELILGGRGADTIHVALGLGALGEQGNDILIGSGAGNVMSGGLGHDTIEGLSGSDFVNGDSGDDTIFGGFDADQIRGGAGNDFLHGGPGTDNIYGGLGKDTITGGTEGDTIHFRSAAEAGKGASRDVVVDFNAGLDKIRLAAIDAKPGGADNAFKWIGAQKFHGKAGELHFVKQDKAGFFNDMTLVQADINGDGRADFEIELTGLKTLSQGDFIL